MEKIDQYRTIIAAVVKRPASSKTINQTLLQKQLLVDQLKNNFLLFNSGWQDDAYVHDLLFHIQLKENAEIWILENNTDYPLEDKLIEAGVERQDLQMAWVKEEAVSPTLNQDKKKFYQAIIKDSVNRMASSTTLNAPDLSKQVIIDDRSCNFALFSSGWHKENYLYDLLLRIELKEHQIWIHENNTDYPLEGVLLAAGVAEEDVVLAWNQTAISDDRSVLAYTDKRADDY